MKCKNILINKDYYLILKPNVQNRTGKRTFKN